MGTKDLEMKEALSALREKAAKDTELNDFDKRVVLSAVGLLETALGLRPENGLPAVVTAAVDVAAMLTSLAPGEVQPNLVARFANLVGQATELKRKAEESLKKHMAVLGMVGFDGKTKAVA